jgi:hypothetical protein
VCVARRFVFSFARAFWCPPRGVEFLPFFSIILVSVSVHNNDNGIKEFLSSRKPPLDGHESHSFIHSSSASIERERERGKEEKDTSWRIMSSKLAKLRATLALLDNKNSTNLQDDGLFNDENNNSSVNSTMPMMVDAKLIQRYESLRHEYITKTIEKAVLEELVTFDGTTFERNAKNNHDSEHQQQQQQEEEVEELELLQQRHDHVLQNVIQAARHVHAQVVHVQTEQAVLQQRKAEIWRMVEELEKEQGQQGPGGAGIGIGASSSNQENDVSGEDVDMVGFNSDGNKNNNDQKGDEVSEQDFAAEEACLAELQEKKVLLQAKLRLLQQETQEMEQDTKNMLEKSELHSLQNAQLADGKLHDDDDDDDDDDNRIAVYQQATAKLQAENEEMRQKVAENKEMISYFDGVRLVMQELGGIRLLSVEQQPPPKTKSSTTITSATENNDDTGDINNNSNNNNGPLVLKVQFLKRHDVEIHLEARENETKRNSNNMRVTQARILTPTLLQGPPPAAAASTTNKNNHRKMPMPIVKLEIPPLDDLVQVAKSMLPDGPKGLHFLVAAILDRLETMQLRVEELSILQNSNLAVLTHVGPTFTYTTAASSTVTTTSVGGGNAVKNINIASSSWISGGQHHAVYQHHQDIACRLVAYPFVAILRLSPDCPRRAGGVVLDQVVMVQEDDNSAAATAAGTTPSAAFVAQFGNDAKKEQLLDDIVKNLHQRQGEFKSPVNIIRAIVAHVEMALKKEIVVVKALQE